MVDGKLSSSLVLCMEILAGCDRVSCEERLYGGFQKLEKWPQGEVGMRGGFGTFLLGGGVAPDFAHLEILTPRLGVTSHCSLSF